jgi:hypothetical protein
LCIDCALTVHLLCTRCALIAQSMHSKCTVNAQSIHGRNDDKVVQNSIRWLEYFALEKIGYKEYKNVQGVNNQQLNHYGNE